MSPWGKACSETTDPDRIAETAKGQFPMGEKVPIVRDGSWAVGQCHKSAYQSLNDFRTSEPNSSILLSSLNRFFTRLSCCAGWATYQIPFRQIGGTQFANDCELLNELLPRYLEVSAMKTKLLAAFLVVLALPVVAMADPSIDGQVKGIELCPQFICGNALFTGFYAGEIGGQPAFGTWFAAVDHEPLPEPGTVDVDTDVVMDLRRRVEAASMGVWRLFPISEDLQW